MPHSTDSKSDPAGYNRRVLLFSSSTPAVITETLYGLISQVNASITTEIQVITTAFGHRQIRQQLFPENKPSLICKLYTLNEDKFEGNDMPRFELGSCVHVIKDPEAGADLEDITEPQHCDATADLFKQRIFSILQDPDSALHCSLAGGRKVMSFFSGYLFSLGGRQQDRLSHTLVSPVAIEKVRNFYFPGYFDNPASPYYEYLPGNANGNESQAIRIANENIRITIVDIPFAPLMHHDDFRETLFDSDKTYSQAMQLAKTQNTALIPDIDIKGIHLGASTVNFGSHQSLALYLLLLLYPEGVSIYDFSAEQAINWLKIYHYHKETDDDTRQFDKHLRLAENRSAFFRQRVSSIKQVFDDIPTDTRHLVPARIGKGLYAIGKTRDLDYSSNSALTKLFKGILHASLIPGTEDYVRQHLNRPLADIGNPPESA